MTTAPDTPQQRLAEYGRLFGHALVGRERTSDAVIWRFAARAGVEAWVRDLADREAACCPFLTYTVTTNDGQVSYQIAAGADSTMQAILDEFHQLPEHIDLGLTDLLRRLDDAGLAVRIDDGTILTASIGDAITSE
jgi:hypothetical protein